MVNLVPADAGGDRRSRLARFAGWLADGDRPWHEPDLAAYRDGMLAAGLSPATVAAHLSTVRARYRQLLRDDQTRDALYDLAGERLEDLGQDDTPANRKAFVDELAQRIENAIDPATATVKTRTSQDRPDSEHLRLTRGQASALLAAPGLSSLAGVRDTAILAVLLCTGIREAELVALEAEDLRQRLGGELALHVREGKGCKERLVPWGGLAFGLAIVDAWLDAAGTLAPHCGSSAGVAEGRVIRAVDKAGQVYGDGITTRAVQKMLRKYPVMVDGQRVKVRPHDLRRTYARRLYEAGVDVVAIQQNLGHSDLKTTLGYIGTLDADRRNPPTVYDFDLTALDGVARQGVI